MKIQMRLAAVLAVLLIISNTLPVCAGSADTLPEVTAPDEAPMFSAHIEYSPQGYIVKGTFTEFLPGTSLVQPLYSLDGEVWQTCQITWDLRRLGSETADDLKLLQNQLCLYSAHEPLADYLAGQLNRFYLKLQITLEGGLTYETQAAVIDRGDPQPLPEEFTPVACFAPGMLIRQWNPFMRYGQYQITVSANVTPEDVSALLPNTLPIEIQLYAGIDFVTNVIVDCPITWKSLSLSQLTAGESVTVKDAAEAIIVPAGTLLNTPNGVFHLNEPLEIQNDEIRLVLNVVEENAAPTGVLSYDVSGLQIAFHLKPTGATAIRAYTLSEDESDWVELPEPLLPEEVNIPSSVAGSAYTLLLKNTSEPYQSYLAALNEEKEPVPFYVGLNIEGGVYDGKQLILVCPDTYELPATLPTLNGAGGNECNAGSDNKNDSTSEGQRPGLPQDPEDRPDTQEPEPPRDSKDGQNPPVQEPPQDSNDGQVAPESGLPQILKAELKDSQPEHFLLLEDETDELTARKADSLIQVSIAKMIAQANATVSIPAIKGKTDSTAWEQTYDSKEHRLRSLLLPAAAATAIGICITAAAGKVTAGSMSGKISGKIIHILYRLLHLR